MRAGAWVEALNQFDRRPQSVLRRFEPALERGEIPVSQQIQMMFDQLASKREHIARLNRLELQQQRFAQVAGADAQGIETLNPLQHRKNFSRLGCQVRTDLDNQCIERLGEIAVIVDGVDDGKRYGLVNFGKVAQTHLPDQMITQLATVLAGCLIEVPSFPAAGSGVLALRPWVFPRQV